MKPSTTTARAAQLSVGIGAALHRENREELRFEAEKNGERDICLRIFEKLPTPGELGQRGAGRREQDEIIPALAQSDGGDANIQDRDVAEERGRIIDTGRKQDRREKSAEQTEDHDDLGVHADSQEKRRARHDRHGSKRGNELDQMIENMGRKNISVENQEPRSRRGSGRKRGSAASPSTSPSR